MDIYSKFSCVDIVSIHDKQMRITETPRRDTEVSCIIYSDNNKQFCVVDTLRESSGR